MRHSRTTTYSEPPSDLRSPWETWLAVLRAAFGLDLDKEQLRAFRSVSGDREPPRERVRELWAIAGRRSGKSRIAAALADLRACFVDHSRKLAPGEQGFVLVLAPTQKQAKLVFNYALAFLEASPILQATVPQSHVRGNPPRRQHRHRRASGILPIRAWSHTARGGVRRVGVLAR